MKNNFTSLLVACVLFCSEVQAWSYGEFVSCNAINPKPKITFLTSYGQLIHDLSTSQSEIERLAGGSGEKGFYTIGLATVGINYRIWLKNVSVKVLDEKHVCLLPEEIEITLGYKNPLIYVSKEINKKSCRFSQVIRHEQVHQRINILTLEYFLPLFDEAVRNAINEVRAVKVSGTDSASLKAGTHKLNQYYFDRLQPIIEEFEKARIKEQKKLDNLTNYKMEAELCRAFEKEHPDKKFDGEGGLAF